MEARRSKQCERPLPSGARHLRPRTHRDDLAQEEGLLSMNVPDTIPVNALPKGFRYASAACGLRRKNRLDLGLILMDEPAAAAGIFTQNLAKAPPRGVCAKTLYA